MPLKLSKLNNAVLVAFSSIFLPSVAFIYISLSLVHSNIEEIRSLPGTYLWIVSGFFILWFINAVIVSLALRGHFQWLARLLIGLGICVLIFDGFRGVWLSSWWHVAIAGLIELAVIITVVLLLRSLKFRTLLLCTAMFAPIPILGTFFVHIPTVGPAVIWNATKEILRPTQANAIVHPNPWRKPPSDARVVEEKFDLSELSSYEPSVEVRKASTARVSNSLGPGAIVARLPLRLPIATGDSLLLELRLRLDSGDIGVGVKSQLTDQWLYRQTALERDGQEHLLYIPITNGPEAIELLFANGRFGRNSYSFEIEDITLYQLADRPEEASATGNAYEILLDAYQLTLFREILEENSELLPDGFVIYQNFRTSSSKTAWSIPTIMSSTYFDPAKDEGASAYFERSFQSGMLADLHKNSVGTYQYSFYSAECFRDAKYCESGQDYRQELFSEISDSFVVDLTFLRLLPNSLRAILVGSIDSESRPTRTWEYGFSVTSIFGAGPTETSEDDLLKEFYYSLNLFTVGFFQKMLSHEVERPATGQFVFSHVMLPHGPHMRDADCNFIPPEERDQKEPVEQALDQSVCALKMLGWLVERLKWLGRYDDALIIVHSDHGGLFRAPPEARKFKLTEPESLPSAFIEAVTGGLLMVKWPQGTGHSTSSAMAQTIDIAPTVLRHFGILQPEHYLGTPLQEMPDSFNRQMEFYAVKKPKIGNVGEYLSKYIKKDDGSWDFQSNIPTPP